MTNDSKPLEQAIAEATARPYRLMSYSTTPPPHITANSNPLRIQDAMKLAIDYYAANNVVQAESLLRQILAVQPKNAPALHLLGVIHHVSGKTNLGIKLLEQAIENAPSHAEFHSNLGEMYRKIGNLDKAIEHGKKATTLNPKSATAFSNLGIAYYDSGNIDKAEECQIITLSLNPKLPSGLNNMGSIKRKQKDKHAAIDFYTRALHINPNYLDALNNLGALLTELERPEESLEYFLRAIHLRPDFSEAHCNIGNSFTAMEQFDKAVQAYRYAIELNANYPEAYHGLTKIYMELNRLQEAEDVAKKSIELSPHNEESLCLMGSVLSMLGYPDKAEHYFHQTIHLNPNYIHAYLGLGHVQMERGHIDQAEQSFRHALNLDNDSLGARLALCMVKTVIDSDDNMASLVEESKKLPSMRETRALPLHFALGKCYDDTGQYEEAFYHYQEGCRLKRKRIDYSADNSDAIIDNICNFFTKETIERLRGDGCTSDVPIFILGMPRSGTTLTEQIIASHPMVYGAGELPDLLKISGSLEKTQLKGQYHGYPASLHGITQAELAIMGENYVSGLRERHATAAHITDKMPANFHALGFIHLILPNAKIIHVKRNPVDTCLSCFTRLFQKSQYHSYDLAEIGRYYRGYARVMEHWRHVLPAGAFYEVQYEDLVSDTEHQARQLLEYCCLEWNDACLEFHKNERNIRTASVTQVRQPIYKTSMERWKKYEAHLAPLLDTLGDLI